MRKLLILGPQGCGKGTQATLLAKKLKIPTFSMGQLLRDEIASGSDLGREIDDIISKRGELVPNRISMSILGKRLKMSDTKHGYIIDGFPRSREQYDAFEEIDEPTDVIVINIPKEESVKRLLRRAKIEARADDTPELINKRLSIYQKESKPLVELYRKKGVVREIDGVGTIKQVARRIEKALGI